LLFLGQFEVFGYPNRTYRFEYEAPGGDDDTGPRPHLSFIDHEAAGPQKFLRPLHRPLAFARLDHDGCYAAGDPASVIAACIREQHRSDVLCNGGPASG